MAIAELDSTSKSKVYRDLRRGIIIGRHKPGERLSVENLAEAFGVSVTPVREALHMLRQDQLVTITPHTGYFVSRISLKQLADLLDMRVILEVAVVERAVSRITEEQLAELEHIHAGYSGADDDAYERYVDENQRFHLLLAEASGNDELVQSLRKLHDRLAPFIVVRSSVETMEEVHMHTVRALRTRDVAAARQTVQDEIRGSHDAMMRQIIEEKGPFWYLGGAEGQV